jgi:hypothetical protein
MTRPEKKKPRRSMMILAALGKESVADHRHRGSDVDDRR